MKKGLKALIIILVIIVVLVGVPFAYLSLSGGNYDDIKALSSQPPMASSERYRINTKDKTVEIKLDLADMLRLASAESGEDILTALNSAVQDYGVTAEKMGVSTDGDQAQIDLRLKLKDFLPLPLSCKAALSEDDGVIYATPDTISIGKLITFDAVKLADRVGELKYDLKELNPLFEDVKSVDFGENEMTVVIPYPMDWLMYGINTATSAYSMIVDFVDLEELDTPVPAMFSAVEGDNGPMIGLLERDTCDLAELKTQLLGLNGAFTRSKFFDEDKNGSCAWLLPEITEESAEAAGKKIKDAYQDLYDRRTGVMCDTWQYIIDAYASGDMTVKNGKLVSAGSEVVLSELDTLKDADWFLFDSSRIILAKNPGDFAMNMVPKGNTITAIITVTHTDRPVILYRYTNTIFKIRSLKPEEYEQLMSAGKIPTFDIGEATTQR